MAIETQWSELVSILIALFMALIAWYQKYQKNEVEKQVLALVPGTVESKTPEIIETLPFRSWKMNDATRQWLTFDATPENKAVILQQIIDAENQKLTHYQIHFDGGYYVIDYGLLMGGAGNPGGK